MKSFSKWVCAPIAVLLLAGGAVRADGDSVAGGKVKSINADKKEFVLTDAAGKDATIKFGDQLVINRAGKDSGNDLKVGDAINVCHSKGVLTWTAHYILVQEGDSKNSELVRGSVKGYDVEKKELTFTNETGKDVVFAMGDAKVSLNKKASKVEDLRIGDNALAIVEKTGDKSTLKTLMAEHK